MEDKAHKQTDKMLAGLEKALLKMFSVEFKTLRDEIKDAFFDMDLKSSQTPIERYEQAQKYDRLKKITDKITQQVNALDRNAIKQVNNEMKNIYKLNYKTGLDDLSVLLAISIPKNVEKTPNVNKDIEDNPSPFNELAVDNVKDVAELRKRIDREFRLGLANGENTNEIVDRIKRSVAEAKLSDIIRIARTQTTRMENLARINSWIELEKKTGVKMYKEWVAVGDKRTRDAHMNANGQIVALDEPFIVDGEKLMYPGDPNGSAENIINCRCTMRTGIKK